MTSTAADRAGDRGEASPMLRTSLGFLALAVVLLFVADIEISTSDPWTEFGRMAWGAVTPDFTATEQLFEAILMTIAFALLGERISPLGIFGAAIILTSCLATQLLGAESEDEAGAGVGAGIGAGVGAVEAVEAVKAKAD